MPFRRPSILTPEGESGAWKRVQGRHVFTPTADANPEEIGEAEIERFEHPTPAYKDEHEENADTELGKFRSVEDSLNVRNIHADGAKEGETYIGEPQRTSKMPDKNKIADVQLNDSIKYYLNGVEGSGKVYAITTEFFTVRKDTGGYQDIQISDVFFVDQILAKGRTWAHMEVDERVEILTKFRCPLSFVTRNWEELPEEITMLIKSNFEQGKYGGIDTSIHFDMPKDSGYESIDIIDDEENFKHDNLKPNTSTGEPEQTPDSYKKPEVKKDGDAKGDAGTAMMAGAMKEDEEKGAVEEEVENSLLGGGDDSIAETEKEGGTVGTGDSGSFNAVHNNRINSDNDNENHIGKMVGVVKSNSYNGIGYGITKLKKDTDLEV